MSKIVAKKNSLLRLEKSDLTEEELQLLKEDLTLENPKYLDVKKHAKSTYALKDIAKYLYYYIEYDSYILIPRNYNIYSNLLTIKADKVFDSVPNEYFKFTKELRDYQKEFISKVDTDDAVFVVPCGAGKTVLALYYACEIKKKTLVLVPTRYLARQWKKRIEQFTTAKVDLLVNSPKIVDIINDNNIVISTLDTYISIITNKKLDSSKPAEDDEVYNLLTKRFYLTILDEAHTLGAESYVPIMEVNQSEKRIALSATFRRSDSRLKVLEYHFGKQFIQENIFQKAKFFGVNTKVIYNTVIPKGKIKNFDRLTDAFIDNDIPFIETKNYISFDQSFMLYPKKLENVRSKIKSDFGTLQKETPYSTYENYISEEPKRIKFLISLIKECITKKRTTIVLSKRKLLLKVLHEHFRKEYKSVLVISETNKVPDEVLDEQLYTADVIFGIEQLAKEGLDVDKLDTVIFTSPLKDTEQAIGRILREVEGKKEPIVIYPIDNSPVSMAMYRSAVSMLPDTAINKKIVDLKTIKQIL